MNYTLTVTPKQLAVIQTALEDYFRTRMGQYFDLTNDLAGVFTRDDDEIDCNDKCARRNAAKVLMDSAYNICWPHERMRRMDYQTKTPEMMIAEDIWAVIRHERYMERPEEERDHWCTAADVPLHIGPEPMVKLGRVDDVLSIRGEANGE